MDLALFKPLHIFLDFFLDLFVVVHNDAVDDVENKQNDCLVKLNFEIPTENRQDEQTNDIESAIAEQWPPRQRDGLLGRVPTQADDEEHVEHGRADNRTEANIVLGDRGSDQRREKFWSGAASRHKRSARNVRFDGPCIDHDLQRAREIDVAHRVQAEQHVPYADAVKDHLEETEWVFPVGLREDKIRWVQGVLFKPSALAVCVVVGRRRWPCQALIRRIFARGSEHHHKQCGARAHGNPWGNPLANFAQFVPAIRQDHRM
mmetsp:Transcript_33260/g.91673  ORF Transcript_33260/g.91673 Transcript_33260/m.91673 type:complete len:261 (-) Transcript_33260:20-802(-)